MSDLEMGENNPGYDDEDEPDSTRNGDISNRNSAAPDGIENDKGVDVNDARVDITDDEKLQRKKAREKLFFKDGIRRIDYILVYTDSDDPKVLEKREVFQNNLREEGVDIEIETKDDSVDNKSYFVKLYLQWDTLCNIAELLYIPKRIIMSKSLQDAAVEHGCCEGCGDCCTVGAPVIEEEDDYFTSDFDTNNLGWFDIDWNNRDAYFTNAERSLCAKEVLDRTTYTPSGREGQAKFVGPSGGMKYDKE